MRLIDADAFGSRLLKLGGYATIGWLKEAPTIDAVPVVRCKDCKFQTTKAHTLVGFCEVWQGYNGLDDGYCVYGERRESNG